MGVNPTDYKLARQWAEVIQALVEGCEDPTGDESAIGDGGRAFGVLQQHPVFFVQFYGRNGFEAAVGDTWTQAFIKAAASFFERYAPAHDFDLVIQAYNQGITAVFVDGVRAPEYLEKYKTAFARLKR